MKAKIFSALKVSVFLAIGLFLFWLAFKGQNLSEIKTKLQNANYYWVLFSLVFAVMSNVIRGIRWNMLIEPSGYKPRLINTFSAVAFGYFANLAVPRLGEVSRCAVLSRYEKIPVSNLLGTVVVERIVDVVALAIILLLTLVLQFNLLSDFAIKSLFHPLGEKLSSLLLKGPLFYVIVFGGLLIMILAGWFLIKKLKTTKFYERFIKLLFGFGEGFRAIGKLKSPWLFVMHSILMWLLYTISCYFCFFAFDFTSHLGFLEALTVMAFGGLGFVAPVQGGIGAYHFIVTQTIMLYGLSYEEGLTFATVSHASQTLMVIVFGILCFFFLPFFNRNYKPDESH